MKRNTTLSMMFVFFFSNLIPTNGAFFLKKKNLLTVLMFSDCLCQSKQIDVRNLSIIISDGAEEEEQAAPDVQRSKLLSYLC